MDCQVNSARECPPISGLHCASMAASTLISLRTALLRNPGKASLLALSASFTAGVVVGRTDAFARTETKDPQLCVPAFTITDQQSLLPDALRKIVGGGNVTENVVQKGTRLGSGTALAVVSPGTLEEAVEVLKACVKAGVAVIPQGAKTGLTGGSVPRDKLCDRPTVVINMRNLNAIIPVGDGEKVLRPALAPRTHAPTRQKNRVNSLQRSLNKAMTSNHNPKCNTTPVQLQCPESLICVD